MVCIFAPVVFCSALQGCRLAELDLSFREFFAEILALFNGFLSTLLGIDQVLLLQSQLFFEIKHVCRLVLVSIIFSRCFASLAKHIFSDGHCMVGLEVENAPFTELFVVLQLL